MNIFESLIIAIVRTSHSYFSIIHRNQFEQSIPLFDGVLIENTASGQVVNKWNV